MAKPAFLPSSQAPVALGNDHDGHGHHGVHHGHGHHDGHGHHGHGHLAQAAMPVVAGLPAMRTERADPPRLSLMALSAGQRLMLVTPVIATLWLLVVWALRDG